ncbi:MAG TPA: carbon-nitrogen hydrolase family protein [Povalibacter sp.]|uniref:carbon-nitrogen hydrolase family protein n=1 Tax=Povalibacter sp. TaxID=1962978 RepID=UPI002BD41AC3|nr:carbon-nitrogen hydrolase family protein [Povalibacter sp.]HMN45440.1 carbon-nitrogen hydrolase family protein [Povalibacter sp.]
MPVAAVIQLTSGPDVSANLASARTLLEQARREGAVFAALPENFAIMGHKETDKLEVGESFGEGPIQAFLAHTARELRLWILGGTAPIQVPESPGKVAAASLLFDDQGRCVARYDKIHLFDVDIPGREERYRESATIAAGRSPTVVTTPIGRLGMAVCYDVRFPELFRVMQSQGAEVLSLPSAFTAPTGKAHWEILLRARAVENLSFVLAPAQGGHHANGRETHGDSMIVDPWGHVLARVAAPGPGLAIAEIDHTVLQELRGRFPALNHRRFAIGGL